MPCGEGFHPILEYAASIDVPERHMSCNMEACKWARARAQSITAAQIE